MSDGNFNRALLPHTPYASGMKAGKQIGKMRAVALYKQSIQQLCPHLSEQELKQATAHFEHELALQLL